MSKRRGFTLIELLVVIAIIAILAAILFPVFAQARESARKSGCLSNTKQIGSAVQMYLQDYDEYFCINLYPTVMPVVFSFYDAHLPYIKNTGVLTCPSEPTSQDWTALFTACRLPFRTTGAFRFFSYNGNYCMFNGGVTNPIVDRRPVRHYATLPLPAEQSVFFDGKLDCRFNSPIYDTGVNIPGSTGIKPPRHSEGVNVSYADGHAKFQKARRLPDGRWVVAGGAFDGRDSLWGLVGDNGRYAGCP
ncbi:MAG: prepilin-type N-terminal cleavage/methylation domain-containing protein [Armatimonadetes bacterium]|nr:prepilin-type N-terminal cleavage/methylation domain-containing protein [Armatimonadota bacterium]